MQYFDKLRVTPSSVTTTEADDIPFSILPVVTRRWSSVTKPMLERFNNETTKCLQDICCSNLFLVKLKLWQQLVIIPIHCVSKTRVHLFLPRCMQCRRGLAMRKLSVRSSVCLSVCPSVKRVDCDKTEERSVQIFMPYERPFSLVFWEEQRFVGATPSTWYFGSTGPRSSEIADFEPIFPRSASAITPREKSSINTNRKSTTCFPMSLKLSSYVAPSGRGSKKENCRFPSKKIALRLKNSRLQSFFVWKLWAAKL